MQIESIWARGPPPGCVLRSSKPVARTSDHSGNQSFARKRKRSRYGRNCKRRPLQRSRRYQRPLPNSNADPNVAGTPCRHRIRCLVSQRRSRRLDRSATYSRNLDRLPSETRSATASRRLAQGRERSLLQQSISVLASLGGNEREGGQAVSLFQLKKRPPPKYQEGATSECPTFTCRSG